MRSIINFFRRLWMLIGLRLGFTKGGGGTPPAPDTTAPVLSSATASATGTTTADIGVTTDEGNGTLYWVVTTSATPPSKAQVKAGQNNGGTAAADSGSQAISSTGAKTASADALAPDTTHYAYFMHEDASGNQSNVAASASFDTDAIPGPVMTLESASGTNPPEFSIAWGSVEVFNEATDEGHTAHLEWRVDGGSWIEDTPVPMTSDNLLDGWDWVDYLAAAPFDDGELIEIRCWKVLDEGLGSEAIEPKSNIISDTVDGVGGGYVAAFSPTMKRSSVTLGTSADGLVNGRMQEQDFAGKNPQAALVDTALTAVNGYFEATLVASPDRAADAAVALGVVGVNWPYGSGGFPELHEDAPGVVLRYWASFGTDIYVNTSALGSSGSIWGVGDTIGVFCTLAERKVWFRHETGGWLNGTPVLNGDGTLNSGSSTGGYALSGAEAMHPAVALSGWGDTADINCGQFAFVLGPPTNGEPGWA